tara:strand:- start:304 stop:1359 length:1056 start_codon:yes stop_codon:yes gene_type:complete
MLKNNKLKDPLNEITLPSFSKLLDVNHHSCTQASMSEGPYFFRYIVCDQETRRMFLGNANMAAGVVVGDALQWHYSHKIWKHNPLTKKLSPVNNEKVSKEVAIQLASEKFNEYNPVDDKDRDKFERYKETIPQTIRQGFLALDGLGISKSELVVAEDSISHIDDKLELPIVGRSDLHFKIQSKDFKSSEQSDGASASSISSGSVLSVLELKTVWDKPGKIKKDGSRSFSAARLPLIPSKPHLQQISFYTVSKSLVSPCCPYLIYLSAEGFQIYSENNCGDLEPANIKNYYNQLVQVCLRRERMLKRYAHLNDAELIKEELVKDIDPDFSHPFYWNIGYEFVKRAKEIWRNT